MRRHWQYLKYVIRHKWFVFTAGLKIGPGAWYLWPLWVYILVFHDWDKFLPDEWFPYARTFYAPDGTKQYIESVEFARAWMLHQHRNKHHWQYWLKVNGITLRNSNDLIMWDRGNAQRIIGRYFLGQFWEWTELEDIPDPIITTDDIPDIYLREMLADWQGAGRAIMGKESNTLAWYAANYWKIKLHDSTRKRVNELLSGYSGRRSTEVTAITNNMDPAEVLRQDAEDLSKLPKDSILAR